jgi:hypothetical protein
VHFSIRRNGGEGACGRLEGDTAVKDVELNVALKDAMALLHTSRGDAVQVLIDRAKGKLVSPLQLKCALSILARTLGGMPAEAQR